MVVLLVDEETHGGHARRGHPQPRGLHIWSVAHLLRGAYKPYEYGRVIVPMVVLRHLDYVLEPTEAKVLDTATRLVGKVENVGPPLRQAAGEQFYSTSPRNGVPEALRLAARRSQARYYRRRMLGPLVATGLLAATCLIAGLLTGQGKLFVVGFPLAALCIPVMILYRREERKRN